MDFDALVEAQTGLGTAAVIVMNKQVLMAVQFSHAFPCKGKPVGLRARSLFSHARAARERILHPS